jgi:hypothetical protein
MKPVFKVSVLIVAILSLLICSNTISRNLTKPYHNCVEVLSNHTIGQSFMLGR